VRRTDWKHDEWQVAQAVRGSSFLRACLRCVRHAALFSSLLLRLSPDLPTDTKDAFVPRRTVAKRPNSCQTCRT